MKEYYKQRYNDDHLNDWRTYHREKKYTRNYIQNEEGHTNNVVK